MDSLPLTHSPPANVIRLSGRTLAFARSVWLFVCVPAALTFLFALPFRWAQLTHPSPTNLANLNALGIAPTAFAAYTLFWEIVIAAPYAIVGFLIFRRCGDERIALLTSLFLIVFGVGSGTITPTITALLGRHPVFDFLQHAFGATSWITFGLFFYLFPNGRFVPSWTRWLALLWTPICIVWNFLPDSPWNPLNWNSGLFALFVGSFWATWIFSQVYRYRRSNAIERQQTKWVVFAVTLIIIVMLLISIIGAFVPGYDLMGLEQPNPQAFAYMFWQMLFTPVVSALPIAIAFSIMRHRLWDINLLINRALVYGALTAFVILTYVIVVGGLGALFQSSGNFFPSLTATGVIAMVINPLRLRLQQFVNRLMYGERDDPVSVLTQLGKRLEAAVAPEAILPTLAESISQALRLPYVAIMLKEGNDFSLAADCGQKPASLLTCERLPLNYQNLPVGQILLSRRAGEDSFNPDEKSLLQNIARQVGVAAYAVQLTRDLQRSRERIVTAREEERRRLRRDLHDGLGPSLASLTLKLDAARNQLNQNPAQAESLLVELKSQTQSALADIRRIAYNLRPPALDELGLFSALREFAANHNRADFSVHVECEGELPKLSAAVEVAAYRIACEAIVNASKHSRGTECRVRLKFDGGLRIEAQDNGAGLPKETHAGVGMVSMRERAAELGGTFTVESSNGVHITALLPCGDDDA